MANTPDPDGDRPIGNIIFEFFDKLNALDDEDFEDTIYGADLSADATLEILDAMAAYLEGR